MAPSIDTANAAMTLAGGVLALIAAVLTLLAALLPRENALEAARKLSTRVLAATPQALSLCGTLLFAFFQSQRVGLAMLAAGLALLSVRFLRRDEPATRIEIFALVFQSCLFFTFVIFSLISDISGTLGRLIGVLAK